jgi:putative transposase
MKVTDVVRVEGDYATLENLSKIANALWNIAIHLNKQRIQKEGKFVFYFDLCNQLKREPVYRLLPSQSAQAVLQKVDGALRSYVKLKRKNLRARMPGYRRSKTVWVLPYKSQQIRFSGNTLRLPLSAEYQRQTGKEELFLKTTPLRHRGTVKYLELYPRNGVWFASVVQEVEEPALIQTQGNIYLDLGIINLAAPWDGEHAMLYKGGAVSATLRYREKESAHLQSTLASHGKKSSKAKRELNRRLTAQTKHAVHALSNTLVKTALNERKGIVAGDLTGILNGKKSRRANQKLHAWQFRLLISQLGYKCRLHGVPFQLISEKNTSKTCVLCHVKHRGGRVHRGLYGCKPCRKLYNADAGASANMEQTYLRRPLGLGVVGALASPAVVLWNRQSWVPRRETNPLNREEPAL